MVVETIEKLIELKIEQASYDSFMREPGEIKDDIKDTLSKLDDLLEQDN